ncbi:dymeclin-like, partial [Trifolium medium]|nr:dymeclin-like [Trifolium medium]
SYLVSSSGEGSRNPIADSSLHLLLVLTHFHECAVSGDYSAIENNKSSASDSLLKENDPDVEGNAHSGRHIKLPFASLFDTLGT